MRKRPQPRASPSWTASIMSVSSFLTGCRTILHVLRHPAQGVEISHRQVGGHAPLFELAIAPVGGDEKTAAVQLRPGHGAIVPGAEDAAGALHSGRASGSRSRYLFSHPKPPGPGCQGARLTRPVPYGSYSPQKEARTMLD